MKLLEMKSSFKKCTVRQLEIFRNSHKRFGNISTCIIMLITENIYMFYSCDSFRVING